MTQASALAGVLRRRRFQITRGYTLLELMLALALLGALLSVAWSLMGTYRDAEQRGWKLAQRTQTIRAAREWLESDIQHLATAADETVRPASPDTPPPRLVGNSLGFSATIRPSLDPLPFLERLMADPSSHAAVESSVSLSRDGALQRTDAQRSPWPAEQVVIEYRLTPATTDNLAAHEPNAVGIDEMQFVLTRRELLDPGSLASEGSAGAFMEQPTSAERVLTAQDLYRQNDELPLDSGPSLNESRLDGLVNVRFRYCDGESWLSEWDSAQQNGMPHAIALTFDFPARSEVQRPEPRATRSETGRDALETSYAEEPSFADSALAAETIADMPGDGDAGLMQDATSQVQIVVLVESGLATTVEAGRNSLGSEL
jgi:prepilin-type N-terminal cleavage/methylation domain-containing protein